MNTPEQIAQWVIDHRYPKSEFDKMSDFEMYHGLVDRINSLIKKQNKSKMLIRVLSHREFDDLMIENGITDENVGDFSICVISIIGSSSADRQSYFSNNSDNVLITKFDDVEETHIDKTPDSLLISLEQSMEIVSFLSRNKDKKQLYVHCAAGISRSGAVGMFANDFFGTEDYFTFINNNKAIKPNVTILSRLKQAYYLLDENKTG